MKGREHAASPEPFVINGYSGEIDRTVVAADVAAVVASLITPTATSETLHWGRNYLYSASLASGGACVEVVVKQFRNQSLKAQIERRLKGSKAERSWRVAWAMRRAGVPTPEPLLLIESSAVNGPSFYVSRRLPRFVEARYYFRALEAGTERQEFPDLEVEQVLDEIGRSIRRLHDAGIWHRDLSIGNLLLVGGGSAGALEIHLVDLNRGRLRRRLGTWQRTRDLCRLRIFRPEHQERFLRAYWGAHPAGAGRKRFLYQLGFRGFLVKRWLKDSLRRPLRGLRGRLVPRHPHVHIPQAPAAAATRDRTVWDGLSDQPHQHATRAQRLMIRLADAPLHARELGVGLRVLPAIRRRYRQLHEELYRQPVEWQGMGIALRPWSRDLEAQLAVLDQLGARRVLLRLHPWQNAHGDEETLAAELHSRDYELAFVLPQNRDLVLDLERWRNAVAELGERFGRYGRHFQVGQAINRSKWGIWNYREYLDLVRVAAEILRQRPENEILGPAVIDYEPLRTAAMVNLLPVETHFDALASLLYVDRRGAPENRQLGFDTVDKVLQLKAIADTAENCGERSWITETNWPLWEGPHSPAGRKVAVDPESQASYLVRYFLLALGTGAVERVYWWQLIARGYGLCFETGDGAIERRPSFRAYATLHRNLEGARFLGPLAISAPVRLYRFRDRAGDEVIVGWTADDSTRQVDLPRPVARAMSRDGHEFSGAGSQATLDAAPRYLWMEPE